VSASWSERSTRCASLPDPVGSARPCDTRRVSDAAFVILLVVCLVVAVGGFVTGLRLVRRVRSEAEAANDEREADG